MSRDSYPEPTSSSSSRTRYLFLVFHARSLSQHPSTPPNSPFSSQNSSEVWIICLIRVSANSEKFRSPGRL